MAPSNFCTATAAVLALLASISSASPVSWSGWSEVPKTGPKPFRLPLHELSHGASFNITVGNPPQTIILLSDWTWQNTWVDTSRCRGVNDPSICIPKGQNYYDESVSTTYHNLTSEPRQSFMGTDYTPGIPFTMSFGTDTVCYQGANGAQLCQENSQVAFSDFAEPLPFTEDIGGIFGFAPVLAGYNKTYQPTPWQMMTDHQLAPVIGWHLCTDLNSDETCDGADALHVMGGTESSVYDAKTMVYHPIVVDNCVNDGVHLSLDPPRNNYWSASWTGLWIDSKPFSLANPNKTSTDPCNAINPIAIMDQDAFGHGIPVSQVAFDYLVGATGATMVNKTSPIQVNGGTQGLWSVDCGKVSTFPTVTYELTGKQNLTATPDMYIDTVYQPGTCFLNARLWDRTVEGPQTFFGLTLLSHTYLVFDYAINHVGLAPLYKKLYT